MAYFRERFFNLKRWGIIIAAILVLGIIASIISTNCIAIHTYDSLNDIPQSQQSDAKHLHFFDPEIVKVQDGKREMQTLRYTYVYENGTYTITESFWRNISYLVTVLAVIGLVVIVYLFFKLNDEFELYEARRREERRRARRKNTSE